VIKNVTLFIRPTCDCEFRPMASGRRPIALFHQESETPTRLCPVKPNTHRRRDAAVELSRVAVSVS